MTNENYVIDRKRNSAVDVAKIIAAILILSLHTNPFSEFNEPLSFFINQGFARLGVPFFFLCSGYFIGMKLDGKSNSSILKNVINRYLLIFCFWSALYTPITFTVGYEHDKSLVANILLFIQKLLFLAPAYMWYIMALIISLVIFEKICNWDRKLLFILMLLLYSFGCLGNTYYTIIQSNIVGTMYKYYFKVFLTTRNGVFFGLPFIITGYLISECYINTLARIKNLWKWMALFAFLYLAEVYLVEKLSAGVHSDKSMYFFLFPFAVSIFASVIVIGENFHMSNAKQVSYFSSCIYCMQYGTIFIVKKVFEIVLGYDICRLPTILFGLVLLGTCIIGYMIIRIEKLKSLRSVL